MLVDALAGLGLEAVGLERRKVRLLRDICNGANSKLDQINTLGK